MKYHVQSGHTHQDLQLIKQIKKLLPVRPKTPTRRKKKTTNANPATKNNMVIAKLFLLNERRKTQAAVNVLA